MVCGNLNTYAKKSPTDTLGAAEGLGLRRRFKVLHTPRHASTLNPVEIGASLVLPQSSRPCDLGRSSDEDERRLEA